MENMRDVLKDFDRGEGTLQRKQLASHEAAYEDFSRSIRGLEAKGFLT
jgi:hypothetical protein